MGDLKGSKYLKYFFIIFGIFFISLWLFIYNKISSYNENRIYNLRKVSKEYRVSLINDYIDRVYKKDSIIFLGDSQTYGFPFPTDKIFTSILQKKSHKNILNLAFQDARILDNIYILKYLKQKNMLVDKVFFNINQAHIKDSNFTRLDTVNQKNYKLFIMRDIKSFLNLALESNPTNLPQDKIVFHKFKNYFAMNNSSIKSYLKKLKLLIKLSKKVSKEIIIYITPHSINAVIYNNPKDVQKLKDFSKQVFNLCREEHIKCLNPNITEDKYFIDIVHFNSLGHKRMAQILKKYL